MALSEARTALSRLHAALDAHLDAVEARTGENDPAVQAAFLDLREAAGDFDAIMFTEHDEVTPFDLPELTDDDEDDDEDSVYGPRVSVISRWDFTIMDPEQLIAHAEDMVGEEIGDAATAVTLLAHLGARLGLAAGGNAKQVGLFWHGTVTMGMKCGPTELGDAWVDGDTFDNVDPDESLCYITDALNETVIPGAEPLPDPREQQ